VIAIVLLMIFALGPILSASAIAEEVIPTIYPDGTYYNFYYATGCDTSGGNPPWSDVQCDVSTNGAGAYSENVNGAYGALVWTRVWKSVNVGTAGTFYAYALGYYGGRVSAGSFAYGELFFYFRIRDLDTGSLLAQWMIDDVSATGAGYTDFYTTFHSGTLSWSGAAGHHYALEAYVSADAEGTPSSFSYADGMLRSGHGISWSYITVYSVPSGGGNCHLCE